MKTENYIEIMNKCCNCGRVFESTKTCWDCKHFIRPRGPEYWGWGDCKLSSRNAHSEDTCDNFEDKEDKNRLTINYED